MLFPHPDGPTRATLVPPSMARERSETIVSPLSYENDILDSVMVWSFPSKREPELMLGAIGASSINDHNFSMCVQYLERLLNPSVIFLMVGVSIPDKATNAA